MEAESSTMKGTYAPVTKSINETQDTAMMTLNIQVENKTFTARLFNNASTQALVAQIPMTFNMSELNGNEKYYYLADSLPTDSQRVGKYQ